jgi:hypothetical protein
MSGTAGIQFQLVSRGVLTASQKSEMYSLLDRHFGGVTREQFARDLAEKNLAMLLWRGETLAGFSTLLAFSMRFEDEPVNVIYSGDTIVAPEAWGSTALPRAWVAGVEALRATLPPGKCYWLLLTSGFRTYRFLPVFWRAFYPRFDQPTPAAMQRLLDRLAQDKFGNQFNPATGIVHFENPQRLRGGLNEISAGRDRDPHIEFFLSRNPGHANGDELVCLSELCHENLTAAGRRMMPARPNELAGHHC